MRACIALLLTGCAAPLAAQTIAVSDAPETVSLTVYRATGRGEAPINKNWPQGYALITETRTVTIPAGESLIRFEGVAEGMFPESAIVTGLPKGVKEKNRDARLLSPSGLVDAYLKREVTLTRTDKATGKVREQQAVITAGPNGGVVLQTANGFEALHCTGLPERMQYGGVPQDLSAKPTLSVITHSDAPVTAKLTLTYMASGFDWQANYVAQAKQQDDGTTGKGKIDIFAWLTLANGGNQSFLNANTMAVAGEPNRERRGAQPRPTGGGLNLKCWPVQRTHQVPFNLGYLPNIPPPAPPPAPMAYEMADAENIVVTGSRMRKAEALASPVAVMVAQQEDLGDLKLYRVPEPVTVNAKGQKQVAMIVKPGTSFDRLYTANIDNHSGDGTSLPMTILFRGENRKEKGLGLPMPSGQVMLFEDSDFGPLLAGQSTLKDRAIGDEIEMAIGQSSDVRFSVTQISGTGEKQRYKVDITNARNEPVNVEIEIPFELRGTPKGIAKIDGVPTWKATVNANGEASFRYELKLEN
ncbi:MAG: hypothetical protein IPG54_05675 [Sphingomonadales bacterium]|jgi:hypothetical protein|nr:hypothetical protein [Sphingomonadales bacterium]MBK9002734.1 hypothetical protein [Sphingomonadales bacterium]MBK9267956.1 hypothetical protein [Sphingomonadales bacterium]MBP6433410.1 hypothetical protein [Sphingorhabdus sp.]